MAKLLSTILSEITTLLADNTTRDISENDVRVRMQDLADHAASRKYIADIATLNATAGELGDLVFVDHYTSAGDFGGGTFAWRAAAPNGSIDNLVAFSDGAGGFWERLTDVLTPEMGGKTGYTSAFLAEVDSKSEDCSTVIQRIFDLLSTGLYRASSQVQIFYRCNSELTYLHVGPVVNFPGLFYAASGSSHRQLLIQRTSREGGGGFFGGCQRSDNAKSTPDWLTADLPGSVGTPAAFDETAVNGSAQTSNEIIYATTNIGIEIDGVQNMQDPINIGQISGSVIGLAITGRTAYSQYWSYTIGQLNNNWVNVAYMAWDQISPSTEDLRHISSVSGTIGSMIGGGTPDLQGKSMTGVVVSHVTAGGGLKRGGNELRIMGGGGLETGATNPGELCQLVIVRGQGVVGDFRVDVSSKYALYRCHRYAVASGNGPDNDNPRKIEFKSFNNGAVFGGAYPTLMTQLAVAQKVTARLSEPQIAKKFYSSGTNEVALRGYQWHDLTAPATPKLEDYAFANHVWADWVTDPDNPVLQFKQTTGSPEETPTDIPVGFTAIGVRFSTGHVDQTGLPLQDLRRVAGYLNLTIVGEKFRFAFQCFDINGATITKGDTGGVPVVQGLDTGFNGVDSDLIYGLQAETDSNTWNIAFHESVVTATIRIYGIKVQGFDMAAINMPGASLSGHKIHDQIAVKEIPSTGVWREAAEVNVADDIGGPVEKFIVRTQDISWAVVSNYADGILVSRGEQYAVVNGSSFDIWQVDTTLTNVMTTVTPSGVGPYFNDGGASPNIRWRLVGNTTDLTVFNPV